MTFYFYDLETSSGSPRNGRIMQFAGQRTNERLEPIGEPDNILVKLADDVLPEPDAILVHGIAPQKTLEEGLSEAEFAEYFHEKVAISGTVFVGFNNIRFDDEFMRKMCYRTFYDPYQWHWKDGRSRWDMLDPIRMMRALRPEGLKWPMKDGKPSVKLELLASENGIEHTNAHDALSDVEALIDVSRKFRKAQPKLFEYLLTMRDKKAVAKLAEVDEAFVYTSGRYSSECEKTTVVKTLFTHPRRGGAIVYDLRRDPSEWLDVDPKQLAKHWQPAYKEDIKRLPVKTMQYNRCPAVAPASVLDADTQERLAIDFTLIKKHTQILADNPAFIENLKKTLDILEHAQQTKFDLEDKGVDDQLYDGFWSDSDMRDMLSIRMSDPDDLGKRITDVKNGRLRDMIPLYKARNYPSKLTTDERVIWDSFRTEALYKGGEKSRVALFSKRFAELQKSRTKEHDQYLLTELQLYVESILPEPEEEA